MKKRSLTRKLLALILVFVLSAGLALPVFADEAYEEAYEPVVIVEIEPIMAQITPELTVEVDGVQVVFADQGPVNIAGTVLVPVRSVFTHMGFTSVWDSAQRVATLTMGDTIVVIPADGTTFTVNGETITPTVSQRIMNNRLMLPLRSVAEAVGATPDWDAATLTAHIITQPEAPVPAEEYEEEYVPVEEYENDYVDEQDEEPTDEDEDEYVEEQADVHPLVGLWVAVDEYAELYFNADGTGIIDDDVGVDPFVWSVDNDQLTLVITEADGFVDELVLTFTFYDEGNTLRLAYDYDDYVILIRQ